MRDVFPGYYKPTDEEIAELWANALVVLDTNALFNLFRYTNATREAFLKVLGAKRDRLWLPYQVGLEFQRGRLGVIEDQEKAFTDLISKARTALATVTKDVGALRNHPTLDLDELRESVSSAIETIEKKIEATRERYRTEVVAAARHDETTDLITDLYAGRVGEPYDEEKLADVFKLGAARYEAKQPPGYKDSNKPEPDRYGDLILWLQILDKAEAESSAVIFVGDDQKEDWWREFKGRKIGPRVELVDEFRGRSGQRIYFLTPHALMELAQVYDDETISKDTVQEVAEVSQAQARLEEHLFFGSSHARTDQAPIVTTQNLDTTLDRLERNRARRERVLRGRLESMRELEANGLQESDEFATLVRALSRDRSLVAELSEQIKTVEFEQMRRGGRIAYGSTWDFPSDQDLLFARFLLDEEGIPALGGAASWRDVPDSELTLLLLRLEAGVAGPAIARALAPISDAYSFTRQSAHRIDGASNPTSALGGTD